AGHGVDLYSDYQVALHDERGAQIGILGAVGDRAIALGMMISGQYSLTPYASHSWWSAIGTITGRDAQNDPALRVGRNYTGLVFGITDTIYAVKGAAEFAWKGSAALRGVASAEEAAAVEEAEAAEEGAQGQCPPGSLVPANSFSADTLVA